jgi:excisionase family DNA binding protein
MTTNDPDSGPNIKPAYSIPEVAALLGLHRATVSQFIAKGELRAARLGHRTVRVTHDALMDFLRSKEDVPRPRARKVGHGKAKS